MPPTNDIVKRVDEIIYPLFFNKEYHLPKEPIYRIARQRFIASRKDLAKCLE